MKAKMLQVSCKRSVGLVGADAVSATCQTTLRSPDVTVQNAATVV